MSTGQKELATAKVLLTRIDESFEIRMPRRVVVEKRVVAVKKNETPEIE